MEYTHRQQREAFHLVFLERFSKQTDSSLFVLKGGLNLRFFFNSPRYSEDMDFDVLGGSVETLRRNGYRILNDRAFIRSLAAFGITDLLVNDPQSAKHTQTTQRFRARLVTTAGEIWPTKVEFSRRASAGEHLVEPVSPQVVRPYQRLALPCRHYGARSAVLQKIKALADRAEPQIRDAFDIYVLWLGGHCRNDVGESIEPTSRDRALENLLALDYADYEGQVLDYLEADARRRFQGADVWGDINETVLGLIEGH
ncbi:MAG: nucleotidyl transferase AbiEii/AbiGii toxin family protein [Gammaproteobacteria bacterium]|nr:nucleotidyl transferase AbiEii/AbiGii toxin family protein [Gammaproteobacteria bacterium]